MKRKAEKEEILRKKESPWWIEMTRTELQTDLNPIFHQSYMLMSSYVTNVSIKIDIYTNSESSNRLENKSTKLYG